RELFEGASPIGQEIRVKNVPFRVIGVLSRKGANAMGMDQDDIILAPWTTIKNRVSGAQLTNVNQSAATAPDPTQKVNTLSNLYPQATPLYPIPPAAQSANTPQPVRFINVDQIMAKANSPDEIQSAIDEITALLADRHHIQPGEPADF